MSEMERHRGIIRRISTPETTKEVYNKLVADGEIDGYWTEFNNEGIPSFIDSDKYDVINGCLFDISDAPTEYDGDQGVEDVEKLNDTDYRIHAYFYNGGACLGEILEEKIPEADAEYEAKSKGQVYYAVKFENGRYMPSKHGACPALYISPAKAEAALKMRYHSKPHTIVKFTEL